MLVKIIVYIFYDSEVMYALYTRYIGYIYEWSYMIVIWLYNMQYEGIYDENDM